MNEMFTYLNLQDQCDKALEIRKAVRETGIPDALAHAQAWLIDGMSVGDELARLRRNRDPLSLDLPE